MRDIFLLFSACAVLIGLQCLHVSYGNDLTCPRMTYRVNICFFTHIEADDLEESARSFVISSEGHSSYLNAELMMLLSGHGKRNPKQKMQAECCCVKAIRWFSFSGGY